MLSMSFSSDIASAIFPQACCIVLYEMFFELCLSGHYVRFMILPCVFGHVLLKTTLTLKAFPQQLVRCLCSLAFYLKIIRRLIKVP